MALYIDFEVSLGTESEGKTLTMSVYGNHLTIYIYVYENFPYSYMPAIWLQVPEVHTLRTYKHKHTWITKLL